MYCVVLECSGVPATEGPQAARDITAEFANHRPHHRNVLCVFSDGRLILTAENDFDADGSALMDEFSDCLCAYLQPFDGDIRLVSSKAID